MTHTLATLTIVALAATTACGEGLELATPAPPGAREVLAATPRAITLITGDLVTVQPEGRIAARGGPGREHIAFFTERRGETTTVIPLDAVPLVASGRLDPALFDVAQLIANGYGDADRADLPLIITGGSDTSRWRRRAGVTVSRALPSVGAVAVRQQKASGGAVLADLAPDQRVWLDRRRKPLLDHSVPQIGAPAAWASGYTGAGVVVAVLDTGVDATHPDLAGKILEAESFVEDGLGDLDVLGHGTHVASIIAGTGAASGGLYQGVAPDADLISGRVCDEFGCFDSWILAGMEWAVVEKHARIVNLSLGMADYPGTDPVEEAVNRLSAQYGALFVVAAGNDGEYGAATVWSPASAEAALAVGAVDREDQLAELSSRGPRVGDGGLKPDLTAPGIGIVAARAADVGPDVGEPVGTAYLRLSGTSPATPHVAGAAALLLQQHADWSGDRLKAALTSSASPAPRLTPFEQGAGRVDVARASRQLVFAEPNGFALGRASWPHDDDPPLVRTLTYHNAGAAPITLTLDAGLTRGGASLSVEVSPAVLTVPAGGSAAASITVDTRGALPDGLYAGAVIATAAGVRVTSPIVVEREVASYELTLSAIDSAGARATMDVALISLAEYSSRWYVIDSTQSLRVPQGLYAILAFSHSEEQVLVYPRLDLSADTTVELDGRLARTVEVSVAGRSTQLVDAEIAYWDRAHDFNFWLSGVAHVATAHLGPAASPDEVHAWIAATAHGAGPSPATSVYMLGHRERGRMLTGWRATIAPRELATVHATHRGAPAEWYEKLAIATLSDLPASRPNQAYTGTVRYRGGFQRTEYYYGPGFRWAPVLQQVDDAIVPGWFMILTDTGLVPQHYRAGHRYQEEWGGSACGPSFHAHVLFGEPTAARSGN